jgi:hypothetical protein
MRFPNLIFHILVHPQILSITTIRNDGIIHTLRGLRISAAFPFKLQGLV